MPLRKYISSFLGFREEIEGMLSEGDFKNAVTILKSTPKEKWKQWVASKEKELTDFLSKTPSKRRSSRLKYWRDDEGRCLFLVAAMLSAYHAYLFAKRAQEVSDLVNLSYRAACARAAELAAQNTAALDVAWPFPGLTPWGEKSHLGDDFFLQSFGFSLDGAPPTQSSIYLGYPGRFSIQE